MDRLGSSRNDNPLTFNIAVKFVFYVLSVSLFASSFSTCVCVLFNPVGTVHAVATYLFYALVLSIVLTFLFVALIGVCFDDQVSSESQKSQRILRQTPVPEECDEVPTSEEAVDGAPIQEAHHEMFAPQKIIEASPIQEEDCESSAPHEAVQLLLILEAKREVSAKPSLYLSNSATLLEQGGERERLRSFFRTPPVEAQMTAIHIQVDVDASIANLAARNDGAPPSTPAASALQQVFSENDAKKGNIDTAKSVDGSRRFCEEMSSLEEMSDADEDREKTPGAKAANHTETDKVASYVISARESRKIENWISQIDLNVIHVATDSDGTLKGDEINNEAPNKEMVEILVSTSDNCDPSSETLGLSPNSDFQRALCVYMGMGPKYVGRRRRGSGNTTPSLGSSEESESQGRLRKMFTLEKSGEKRKARSV